MFKIYFSEWGEGKLQRLPYFGYHLLFMFSIHPKQCFWSQEPLMINKKFEN